MPHEIKNPVGLGFHSTPSGVLDRPKLAMYIGAMAATMGQIDNQLGHVFALMTIAELSADGSIISEGAVELGTAIESAPFKMRIDIVREALRLRVPEAVLSRFDELFRLARNSARERNDVVHKNWYLCEAFPHDLVAFEDKKWIRYTESDLIDRHHRAVNVRNQIHDFIIALTPYVRRRPS
ncbi:hypothetical protein [Neorhizobium sp. T7_12]|uniref:hypothetical protein n=1 Tax=Neorhizobium sp. T7_12 TaxID=2093832 RepID=UPI00155E4CCD|nr:hypothetical protein [Neorhizobium sp. T7_12]